MSYLLLEDGSRLLLEDGTSALLLEDGAGATFDGGDVLEALEAWWLGTPAATALSSDGKLWHVTIPQGVSLPYATCILAVELPDTYSTSFAWVRATVQFNLHASTPAAARALGETFRGLIEDAPITIDGEPVAHVLPDTSALERGEGLGPGGRDCWIAMETIDVRYTQ